MQTRGSFQKEEKLRKELLGTKTKAAKTDKCRTSRILIGLSASISSTFTLIEYEKENTKHLKRNTYSTQGKQHHFILVVANSHYMSTSHLKIHINRGYPPNFSSR